MECCSDPKFELIEELGHVEGVDWDLGRCGACGSHVLHQWSPHRPALIFNDKLTDEEFERIRQSHGNERLTLLKARYADG
jgi:hypothetical protein